MLSLGPAKKVTIHLNADTSASHDFLYRELFSFLLEKGVSGATLIRPAKGFGVHRRVHAENADGVEGEHLPVQIEFIETAERLNAILPELLRLVTDGLIEAQDTTILKLATTESTPL